MKDSVKKSLLRQALRDSDHNRGFLSTAIRKGLIDNMAEGIEYLEKNPLRKRNQDKKQS